MLVTISKAQGYGYVAMPVNKRISRKIEKYLEQYDVEWNGIYLQELYQVQEFLGDFSRYATSQLLEISHGWDVTIRVDAWTFLQGYVGYDAGDNLRV